LCASCSSALCSIPRCLHRVVCTHQDLSGCSIRLLLALLQPCPLEWSSAASNNSACFSLIQHSAPHQLVHCTRSIGDSSNEKGPLRSHIAAMTQTEFAQDAVRHIAFRAVRASMARPPGFHTLALQSLQLTTC